MHVHACCAREAQTNDIITQPRKFRPDVAIEVRPKAYGQRGKASLSEAFGPSACNLWCRTLSCKMMGMRRDTVKQTQSSEVTGVGQMLLFSPSPGRSAKGGGSASP